MRGIRRMYELTYVLTSVLSADQITEVVSKITAAVKNVGGEIKQVEQWGMKRLAYPVAKKRNGYYVNMYFEGPGVMVARIERLLAIDDHVLRFLTLALDRKMVEAFDIKRTRSTGEDVQGGGSEVTPAGHALAARYVDYKDTERLKRYMNEQGKMLPRRVTETSAKRQRAISTAIKRARHLALLPYVSDTVR